MCLRKENDLVKLYGDVFCRHLKRSLAPSKAAPKRFK